MKSILTATKKYYFLFRVQTNTLPYKRMCKMFAVFQNRMTHNLIKIIFLCTQKLAYYMY